MKDSKKVIVLMILMVMLVMPGVLQADTHIKVCDPQTSDRICNPITATTLQGFIKTLLEGILKIGMPLIALAIIYAGFLFVAARGNSEKLTKARQTLMYTLIGAAILLGSWAIAKLISETVLAL